jgi:hypothetical protein
MDINIDMDIDEMWSSALQNFEDCAVEEQKQTPPPHLALLDEDIDIDSIWQTAMDNFKQCTSEDRRTPVVRSKTSFSSDLEPQGSMHISTSPSSSSYVPSPHRKNRKNRKRGHPLKKEATKAVFEDGVNDEEADGPWEHHESLGLVLHSLPSDPKI